MASFGAAAMQVHGTAMGPPSGRRFGLCLRVPRRYEACERRSRDLPNTMSTVASPDELKRAAAARALDYVEPGMRLGLGTGSTARDFVGPLGERVGAGVAAVGVPT